MSAEANNCCGVNSAKSFISSVTYTQTVVKTQLSFSDLHGEMLSASPELKKREQSSHEQSVHQQIMASLPDIQNLLKPWFFRQASEHNFGVLRQASLDISNQPNSEMSYEVAFKQIRYVNGLWEGKPGCQCDHSGKKAESNGPALEDILTEDDKIKLESLHQHASETGEGTEVIDSLAAEVAGDRIFSKDKHQPILDRGYLDNFLAKAVDLKNGVDFKELFGDMKDIFS